MFEVSHISKYQFFAFRVIFGLYLCVHFAGLLPYGPELFSNEGTIPDSRLNFTHGILPNPLEHWDSPQTVTVFLGILLILSMAYSVGLFRRICAFLLWFGWASLFNRNNLISNPSIPYVGLLLLFSVIVPPGEAGSIGRRTSGPDWVFPRSLFATAWFLMAIGYTFSGIIKLYSPSWVDGTALIHVVNNPLARPGTFRNIFLSLPEWALKFITWSSVSLEILFLPLCIHRITRLAAWLSMLMMHLGIMLIVDFADLTLGMVMIHLFTFDPSWLPGRPREEPPLGVLYDGVCGLCDRFIQFLIDQDREGILRFAPLQGETAAVVLNRHPEVDRSFQTVMVVRDFGNSSESVSVRSSAVFDILKELGGFWRVVSWLRVLPRFIRDAGYGWVAENRYRWFGQYDKCRLPSPTVRQRFLP